MSPYTVAMFVLKCVLATMPTVVVGCVLSRWQLLESSLLEAILIGGVGAIALTYITQSIGVYYLALGALLLPVGMYKGDLWNIYLRGKSFQYKLVLAIIVTVFTAIILALSFLLKPH